MSRVDSKNPLGEDVGLRLEGGGCRRAHLLALVAPALLIIVVIAQITLVATAGLTPWKGGGFGMFATVDDPHSRALEVDLTLSGESARIILFDLEEFESVASVSRLVAARSLPSDRLLAQARAELATVEWARTEAGVEPVAPTGGERAIVERIAVVRLTLDGGRVAQETVAEWERR